MRSSHDVSSISIGNSEVYHYATSVTETLTVIVQQSWRSFSVAVQNADGISEYLRGSLINMIMCRGLPTAIEQSYRLQSEL
jgi:hypothetical protein